LKSKLFLGIGNEHAFPTEEIREKLSPAHTFHAVIADQHSLCHPVLTADSPLILQVVREVMV
jgi:hypothetical protein